MSGSSSSRKRSCFVLGSSSRANILQDEAHERLITSLQRMVNRDESSDVSFICKDGRQVKAIRLLLVDRCDVLKGMLANGMRETSLQEISLPEFSSQTLLCVFEYLYAGTVSIYQPKEWRLRFEVAIAAQYFLLQNLVDIVLELILDEIPEVAADLPEVAAMLTVTLEFSRSCQEGRCHAILTELIKLLGSNWTNSTYASKLSEDALEYLLLNTAEHDVRVTYLREYYRFRQVILWWAYENVSGWSQQAEEIVESAVPLIEDTSSLLVDVCIGEGTAVSHPSLRLKSLLISSKDSAMRLLSSIDLRHMHLFLVEKMVKPLDCFSSSKINQVYRYHALKSIRRGITFDIAKCGWKHGTPLTTREHGSSVENTGRDAGTAIALMRMSSKVGVQLWRVRILTDNVSHVELGLIFIDDDGVSGWSESDLANKPLASLPDVRVVRILSNGKETRIDISHVLHDYSFHADIRSGSWIEFMFDLVEHNCSVYVNGREPGICWGNLPDLDCYPAVFIGESERPHSVRVGITAPKMTL